MAKGRREIILIRSLKDSDLGIFDAHRGSASSKQRAININSITAEQLLSKAMFRAGGCMLDCICTYQDASDRSHRHFGKVHKNWRLGGNKLEGAIYGSIDSADFVLIRSIEGNDGKSPVSITFVARSTAAAAHAALSKLMTGQLRQSMAVVGKGDAGFADIAAMCPAPPEPAGKPVKVRKRSSETPPVAVPPMPLTAPQKKHSRTVKEKVRSPHIIEQMLKASGDMSAPAQLDFLDTVEQLADQLRKILLRTGRIIRIDKDHAGLWSRVAGQKIGFVDGGMANLSMVGAAPVAVRVGGYIVTPGDKSQQREKFITLKKLIAELYANTDGGVYNGSFPDVGALRDAARISIEAAGGVKVLQEYPDTNWLFMHGSLVNPVSRYTDVMKDRKVRYAFPDFSTAALQELLPEEEHQRTGREANFISVYLRQLELLLESKAVVCGVVERESHSTSVIRQIIQSLDDDAIRGLLPLPPEQWKDWFLSAVDPSDDEDGHGQRITDPLLFRCVLEPGEALLPVKIDRNELRRAPDAWKDKIGQYPTPFVSYTQPTEWNAPVRLEMFEKDLGRFEETASLVLHCSLLLPRYAFPVGLDIVDKFAKIPDWMSRPVNTNTVVQSLKRALDRGDTRLFDSLRRMLCGSQREWLLRPGIYR
ncbi:DNA double-strand break repair nuclease NurA [Bradyrhizobium zhanjiangense]|uniref:DNA double-strand break repair nuclease NurA n=1 Tax=Bradyrhizobium zhanjiangense TaxID=1325107 RepID=A0A4Q0Q641_9BRAD|nr:DNA double-strand break repair nuclease NurA [Bradyrhizobium zhanjiangense]RXG84483.1 DNA double-strand break repair nuclease NurA [Bradyrhizobium zhanjiangense]